MLGYVEPPSLDSADARDADPPPSSQSALIICPNNLYSKHVEHAHLAHVADIEHVIKHQVVPETGKFMEGYGEDSLVGYSEDRSVGEKRPYSDDHNGGPAVKRINVNIGG